MERQPICEPDRADHGRGERDRARGGAPGRPGKGGILLWWDINARALAETALSLGPRASARVCDLTDEDAFHSAARSLAAELDIAAPDGLVNCAGVPGSAGTGGETYG